MTKSKKMPLVVSNMDVNHKQGFPAFLRPPVFNDPAARRVANILNIVFIIFFVCNLLGSINMFFYKTAGTPQAAWVILVNTTVYGVGYYFLHRKCIAIASWFMLCSVYITALLFTLSPVPNNYASILFFVMVIAIAGVILRPMDVAIVVGVVLATLTMFQSSVSTYQLAAEQTIITYIVLIVEGIILIQASSSLEQSYTELRKHVSELTSLQGAVNEGAIIDVTDLQGRIEFANDNFVRISKYSREELIEQDHRLISSGNHSKEFIRNLWATITNGEIWRGEVCNKAKDGSLYWVDTTISPILDEYGKPEKYLVVRFDITDRKRAEQERLASQQLLQLVMDNIPQLIFWKDRNSVYQGCNQNFAQAAGVGKPANIVGKSDYDLPWKKEEANAFRQDDEAVMSSAQPKYHIIEPQLQADGRQTWADTNKIPMFNTAGEVIGVLGTYEDITERKLAEAALLHSQERLAEAVEIARLGHWEYNVEKDLFTFNEYFYAVFHTSVEKMGGYQMSSTEYIQRFVHSDDASWVAKKMREIHVFNGHTYTISFEHRVIYADGDVGYISVKATLERGDDGRVIRSSGINQDITERKRVEARLQQQLNRVQSLRNIDLSILGATDLRLVLKTVLEETAFHLQTGAAMIHLLDPSTLLLEPIVSTGEHRRDLAQKPIHLGEGIIGATALERRTLTVTNAAIAKKTYLLQPDALMENAQALYATPLIVKGKLIGVLSLIFHTPFDADQDWMDYFETLAGQAAMAVDSCKSFEDLQRAHFDLALAYDTTIKGWSRALDLRDKETEGHTQRVTELTMKMARLAGVPEKELMHVHRGALLHDIGKMGIPDEILLKPGALTETERNVMRQHPTYAYEMLLPITYLHRALDIPYCHHEKWDGTGYPRGLKGKQIPLAARLFAVVDVWDALRSDRPYRKGWSEEKVLKYIHTLAGTHFDPKAVELFLKLMEADV